MPKYLMISGFVGYPQNLWITLWMNAVAGSYSCIIMTFLLNWLKIIQPH